MNGVPGELIVKFSRNPKRIVREYTKFKINKGKCQSYLDIHLPNLILTEQILNKCVTIFKLLLRYADGCECLKENDMTFWKEFRGWSIGICKIKLFKELFYNDISILCDNPNHDNANEKEFSLEDILTQNDKYTMFNDYWTTKFDCLDLIDTLRDVSKKVLKCQEFSIEIIELILCMAI